MAEFSLLSPEILPWVLFGLLAVAALGFFLRYQRLKNLTQGLSQKIIQHSQTLQDSEVKSQLILETVADAIISTDQKGVIQSTNKSAENIFGYSKEEFQQLSHCNTLFLPLSDSDNKSWHTDINACTTGIHKTGKKFPISVSIGESIINSKSLYTIVVRDLSEEKDFEDQKKAIEMQLLQTQKLEAVGKLAGGIAHDFNNLLGAILGYATIMRNQSSDEKSLKHLEFIIQSAERGAELTKQLLSFARKGSFQRTLFNVNNTVQDVVNIVKKDLNKNIKMTMNLHPNLKFIEGVYAQIHQILVELGNNAKEAMPEGGQLTFTTTTFEATKEYCDLHPGFLPGHYISISVTDTGRGIPEVIRTRIFDPFFTTKKLGAGGSGLGLSMVHGIMKNHDGIVAVQSQEGQGTNFQLYFRVKEKFSDDEKNRLDIKPPPQEKLRG